jgi:hypothetical protein
MNRLFALAVLAPCLLAAGARADCDRDSDCKGGRVCVANKCIERKYCVRDKDCPGDQVCDRNNCTAPNAAVLPVPDSSRPSSGTGSTGWGTSREQAASLNAGMALQYTRNTWPLNIVDRPLVVAPGMTEAQIGIGKDVSEEPAGSTGFPHPLTGDVYARFGVSDRIHAGLDAVSVCFTDCGDAGFFRLLSVGAGYAVVANHNMNLVPSVTAAVYNFGNGTGGSSQLFALQPGFLFGWRMSSGLQLFGSGGLVLGVIGRDNTSIPDLVGFHVEPRIALGQQLSIAPYVGYSVGFAHTEFYTVPLGVTLMFVPARAVDIGGTFEFSDRQEDHRRHGSGRHGRAGVPGVRHPPALTKQKASPRRREDAKKQNLGWVRGERGLGAQPQPRKAVSRPSRLRGVLCF